MKKYWKTIGAISFILVVVILFWSFSFSQQEKGTMPQKSPAEEMMGNMDKMMEQKMTPGCMGMMSVNEMGMTMHNLSQNMKSMLENMDSMMKNPEMMKDEVMKKQMEAMQDHMKMMTEHMQGAMNSMQEMTKRMEETQPK
jgi:ElaB/YqjD/DUF883 family membrane-anchored ribosome-binding protein